MAALEDGRTVALGEKEGGFLLWDVPTGREVFRLTQVINCIRHPFLWGGAPVICRVAVVPGTGLLAYTDCRSPTNGFVHLWHVARRELVRSLPVQGIPRHLAASPDGRQVACSLMRPDRRTLVFDVADGRTVATLETDFSSYSACHTLAFSADGRALSLEDVRANCLRVVEIATGHDRHRFPFQQDYPLTAVFSPDGRWLVMGVGFDDSRPRVEVWDLHTGNRRAELPASSPFALHFSPDGRRLVAGLSLWRVPEFTLERRFDGVGANGKAVLLLADGDTLLSEDGEGGILRWSLKTEPPNRGGHRFDGCYEDSAFLPRGGGILLVHTNGSVEQALAPGFRREPIPELGTNAATIASLPERRQIAVGRRDGSISLHAADTFAELARFTTLSNSIPRESFWVPLPGWIVLRTRDERLEVWDPGSGQQVWDTALLPVRELSPPTAQGVLWQVHADGWLAGYDVGRRRVIHQPLDHDGMHRLALSPSGRWLLTTSPEGTKRLVETANWRTVDSFPNLDMPAPHGGAFWPNEPRIGFSGLTVVDQVTGRELLRLDPGIPFPHVVRISDDGNLVVNAGERNTACLWWAPSWEEIRQAQASPAGGL
jgi:WD40 repeat protein